MNIRQRSLPNGWYPDSKMEIQRQIHEWLAKNPTDSSGKEVLAGVAPHAGWMFCGSLIARVAASLSDEIDTLVILGGHEPSGGGFTVYSEDVWETPSGSFVRDSEFAALAESKSGEGFSPECYADNTVEVVFTLASALKPQTKWAAWRLPADRRAEAFGENLAESARELGRKVAVIGSTDLSHYGSQYNFRPRESLEDPLGWVEKHDRHFMSCLIDFDAEGALKSAAKNKCSCSAGAAVAAMAFARKSGARTGELLEYKTSREVSPGESFVAYGGLIWH